MYIMVHARIYMYKMALTYFFKEHLQYDLVGFQVASTVFQSFRNAQLIYGGGRPIADLFLWAQMGIWVEPPTFTSQRKNFQDGF